MFAGCNIAESVMETTDSATTAHAELPQTTTTIQEIQTDVTTVNSTITEEMKEDTSTTVSIVLPQTTTNAVSTNITEETIVSTTTVVTTVASTTTYESTTTHQENVVSSEEKRETSDIASKSAETTAAPESEKEKCTIFKDCTTKKKFIILNLTAEKVYWNEAEDYSISEGETVDIAVPAIFSDWFTDTDDAMFYLGEHFQKIPVMNCGDMTVRGIAYTNYWSMDNICLIDDGIVHFGEYTEEMKNAFRRIDSGYFIEEANYYYPEFPLEDGMTVENLDLYFETMKTDRDVLYEKIASNPDTDYDIAGFWGWIDGIRLRGKVNFIY